MSCIDLEPFPFEYYRRCFFTIPRTLQSTSSPDAPGPGCRHMPPISSPCEEVYPSHTSLLDFLKHGFSPSVGRPSLTLSIVHSSSRPRAHGPPHARSRLLARCPDWPGNYRQPRVMHIITFSASGSSFWRSGTGKREERESKRLHVVTAVIPRRRPRRSRAQSPLCLL